MLHLTAAPRSPDESRANVRVMYGHGLNKQTWAKFTERFPQVGRIVEVQVTQIGDQWQWSLTTARYQLQLKVLTRYNFTPRSTRRLRAQPVPSIREEKSAP